MVDASTPVELGDIWTYFAERECGEYSPLYNRIVGRSRRTTTC